MSILDLFLAFGLFLVGVVICMIRDYALYMALAFGFVCFFAVGLRRGFGPKALLKMAWEGSKTSLVVLRILVLVGVLTGLWRAGGTIVYFVATGLRILTPASFVLVAFLLSALLSLAFGSCFGVSGTAGIILMTMARTGGADLAMTAGAALSGAFFGERLSPASSAAALVSAVSKADQGEFQRQQWRDTWVPLAATLAFYTVLSLRNPIPRVDMEMVELLESSFQLNWITLLPAAVLLILPWFKVKAARAILISCGFAALSALFVQKMSLWEVLQVSILGYQEPNPALAQILSGGGLISMKNSVLIVFLSCSYAGIFRGTGMLDRLKEQVCRLAERIGRMGAQIIVALGVSGVLCNQSVSIVMTQQIMEKYYEQEGISGQQMARDIGNTVLNLAGTLPWCIACSVCLANMEATPAAVPYAVYLYLLPLWAWWKFRVKKE